MMGRKTSIVTRIGIFTLLLSLLWNTLVVASGTIIFDENKYSPQAEQVQRMLNVLQYKDNNGEVLSEDGYFGAKSRFALEKFLVEENYTQLNQDAYVALKKLSGEPSDIVLFEETTYVPINEYYQYCLKYLGYKKEDGSSIDLDGHFGNSSQQVLQAFLKDNGFTYPNSKALALLKIKAETKAINEGKITGTKNKLPLTLYLYNGLLTYNGKTAPFIALNKYSKAQKIITNPPEQLGYTERAIAKALTRKVSVYGYVNIGPDNPNSPKVKWKMANLTKVKKEIKSIKEQGWTGVFVDQFGFDFHETRSRQNEIINYAHSLGLKVQVNAWFPKDVFGNQKNKYNPKGIGISLKNGDTITIESFYSDGEGFRDSKTYIQKYKEWVKSAKKKGVKVEVLASNPEYKNLKAMTPRVKASIELARSLQVNSFGMFHDSQVAWSPKCMEVYYQYAPIPMTKYLDANYQITAQKKVYQYHFQKHEFILIQR